MEPRPLAFLRWLAHPVTIQTVMGFLLAFLGHGILTAAWWTEARRNDRTDHELAAIRAHLGIDQETPVPDPITEPLEIPTQPSDIPLQVQAALLKPTPGPRATPADDPEWRRRFGLAVEA